MRVVVVGDVMVDVVARHAAPLAQGTDNAASVDVRGGGAGGNVAAWLAHAGVDVALAAPPEPGLCVVLVGPGGERTMLPDPGANLALRAGDIPEGDVLYVSGYTLMRPQTRAIALEALRRAPRTVIDPASAPQEAFAGVEVDLVIRSAHEAVVAAREVVVTRGAEGATHSSGASIAAVPATVVDTTGAGDAFAAGFIAAWDQGPEAALASGAALAAQAVTLSGARPPHQGPVALGPP